MRQAILATAAPTVYPSPLLLSILTSQQEEEEEAIHASWPKPTFLDLDLAEALVFGYSQYPSSQAKNLKRHKH